MNLKSLAGTTSPTLIFALLAAPAFASSVNCASGNLATIDGTTCDIGNLQFTFTGLQSGNSSGPPWTDSDFMFTVLSNGFQLSGPPAQTIMASNGGYAQDYAELNYSVMDLTNNILGLDIAGGTLSVSGPGFDSIAENDIFLANNVGSGQLLAAGNTVTDSNGIITDDLGQHNAFGGPITAGFGEAIPFGLVVDSGVGTASIDSTTTDFTFITGIPEPRSLTLISFGVLSLLSAASRKLRH